MSITSQPYGELVSSFWQTPTSNPHIRDCLIKDYPRFIGPVNGNELWWAQATTSWPALTGSSAASVAARFARP